MQGGNAALPLDADDEDQLGLGRDVEGAILLGGARKADLLALVVAVLLDVLLSALEDDATLLLVGLGSHVSKALVMAIVLQSVLQRVRSDPKDGI